MDLNNDKLEFSDDMLDISNDKLEFSDDKLEFSNNKLDIEQIVNTLEIRNDIMQVQIQIIH